MQDGHAGVSLGSEISGDWRNIFIEDCRMNRPALNRAMRLKIQRDTRRYHRNVWMRRIDVGRGAEAILTIDLLYEEGAKRAGTTTVTVNKVNNFTGSMTLTASGLPTGVAATFVTNPTTGTSVATFTASSTAVAAIPTVTITGVSGTLTHTATVSLTVTTSGGSGGGGVTATVSNSLSACYNDESLVLANTATLTALTITITIQNTQGVTFNNIYNTIGSQITQSHAGLVYTFTLASGQTLGVGTGKQFHATTNGTGTMHVSTADTWSITYTTGGTSYTNSGHF
jgi:hypothetical protein